MHMRTKIQNGIVEKAVKKNLNGKLILATGVGKGRITIESLKKLPPGKVLWLCPTIKARDETIPEEFRKWQGEVILKNTDIICYASLSKITGHYNYVILDEGQFITEANTENINKTLTYDNMLLLTATEPKELEKIEILRKFNLPLIDEIHLDKAVELGLVAPYEIEIHYLNLDATDKYIKVKKKDKTYYFTELERYNYLTETIAYQQSLGNDIKFLALARMRLIYNSKTKQNYAKALLKHIPKTERTLIFSKSIKVADSLDKCTYHSKSKKVNKVDVCYEDFNAKRINRLSVVNSANQALNFTDVDGELIVQLDSKDRNLIQRLGRSIRLRDGHKSKIRILCFRNTVDEKWTLSALEGIDKDNIYEV